MRKGWLLIGVVLVLGCGQAAAIETQPGADIPGKIAFVSDRFNAQWSVCVLENGIIKKVYEKGAGNPKWSPDGSLLAVSQHDKGFRGIVVIDEKGGHHKYPVENRPFILGWLPEADQILFSSNRDTSGKVTTGNLFLLDLPKNKVQQLTQYSDDKIIQHLTVSWDGKKVIFLRVLNEPTNKAALSAEYLMGTLDGENLNDIKVLPVYPTNSSWSPDSKRIVYTSGYYKGERVLKGYLLMYDFETGEETLVHENKENFIQPVFSPDGKQILVSAWSGLYVMDIDGTNVRQVVPPKNLDTFDSHDTRPDWAA